MKLKQPYFSISLKINFFNKTATSQNMAILNLLKNILKDHKSNKIIP